jgi:P27 family predicted phage terminase small subunit
MARGRRGVPDELKALKGNAGKRKLNLADKPVDATPAANAVLAPDYLVGADEKRIFKRVSEELNQVRFVRRTDTDALARWCVYMAKWVSVKRRLDSKDADVYYETASKHGTMLRVHPLFAALFKIEQHLMSLEDRIGLNPTSRQSILRGLINAPQLPNNNDLFGEGAQKPEAPLRPSEKDVMGAIGGPVGFLTSKH